ncbi:hypothetical protein ACQKH5_01730 [Hyphomonas sp. NPDC076900]|uniref:hypothetical protein n=1 Tax=unclassified Hyphomonas TaxID=2630699 RepID=UPI003D02AABD
MMPALRNLLIPALVVNSVLVGGGFATGRELVEFFLKLGPATGLAGMTVSMIVFSLCAAISYELARRRQTFDYNSFNAEYLFRFRYMFEVVYVLGLLLVLAVVSAAASELLHDWAGLPKYLGAVAFIILISLLLAFPTAIIERVISLWSLAFVIIFALLAASVLSQSAGEVAATLSSEPVDAGAAIWNGLSYSAYNAPIIAVVIFVARRFRAPGEALIAGALVGPLALLPAFTLYFALLAFYPAINDQPVPILHVLDELDLGVLGSLVELIVFGALLTTGAGLLHGLNERVIQVLARRMLSDERSANRSWSLLRAGIAFSLLFISAFLATAVGLIDLIGSGYRFAALIYIFVFILPLILVGGGRLAWSAYRRQAVPSAGSSDGQGSL